LKRPAKIVLSIGLCFLLIHAIGSVDVVTTLADADGTWLAGAYAAFLGVRLVEATQLKVLLFKVGVHVSVTRVFMANALSALYAFALPGDLAAALAKWNSLSAATGQRSTILNAIVYNRLALLLPVLALGSGAIVWRNPMPGAGLVETVLATWTLASAAALALYHPRRGPLFDARLHRMANRRPAWLKRRLESFTASLGRFRTLRLADHAAVMAFSLLAYGSALLSFWCAARALDAQVPFATLLWTLALLRIAGQLPLTTSNLGVREGLLILVLAPYGVTAPQAVALGLVTLSKQIVMALVGLVYQVWGSAGGERHTASDSNRPTSEPSGVTAGDSPRRAAA
jgi:uncharacterized membrane protein YbhN (UPF0104 family)